MELSILDQLTTEIAWGSIWTRPGLELKQRSLIVIALLTAQGKEAEVGEHCCTYPCDD